LKNNSISLDFACTINKLDEFNTVLSTATRLINPEAVRRPHLYLFYKNNEVVKKIAPNAKTLL